MIENIGSLALATQGYKGIAERAGTELSRRSISGMLWIDNPVL